MNPTSTADVFDLFRAARPGQGERAVQAERIREIAVSRQIPFIEKSPDAFAAKLNQLPLEDQAYILSRIGQGLPAAIERRTPSGRVREVWFPVDVSGPTPESILAQQVARGTLLKPTNEQVSRERLHTLLDGRQVGNETLQTVVGGAYGYSMVGK